MLSPVRLSSIICSARGPYTQAVEIFGNISTAFGILAIGIRRKFYGDRPTGTSPSGELNPRGVAKYSDFECIEGYISETLH